MRGRIILELLNRSIAAGWLILAVIFLRLLLKKAPKWTSCLLWAIVAVRLACPFSLESVFSLIPSRETVRMDISASTGPSIDSGIAFVDNAVNPVLKNTFSAEMQTAGTGMNADRVVNTDRADVDFLSDMAGIIWAAGMVIMLFYGAAGYICLRLRIRTAVCLQQDGSLQRTYPQSITYISEFVDTPFIFGVLRPRIYLPSSMPEDMREPVLAHETAHLERRDNLWKILAFILLCVYWFQPLCWAAYILFGRDVELACDEKVIRDYDPHQKRLYSEALLACSMGRRTALACPLAFGEVGVKERIWSVLRYKKPGFWMVLAALAVCAVAAVCFLTDPAGSKDDSADILSESGNSENNEMSEEVQTSGGESMEQPASDGGQDSDTENGQQKSEEMLAAHREELAGEWARAFVSRDGEAIASMVSEELVSDFVSGPVGERSFGVSSPWPRDEEKDGVVLNVGEKSAEIRYYAWTSDPHVTVWYEEIFYELRDGKYMVTAEKLAYLDAISTCEEFGQAYGIIDGSSMDYEANGEGENLNFNAMLSSSLQFRGLFEPESAAVELLNLSEDPAIVQMERLYEEENEVNLKIVFAGDEDGLPMFITMTRPYGSSGIWIPKDYRVDIMARLTKVDWEKVRDRHLSVTTMPGGWSDIVCIAELPEKNIKLYGYNDSECFGQGVAVDINGDVSCFDWYYTTTHTILPKCYWKEETGQLQVSLHIYTGTGVSADELHVLQQSAAGGLSDSALEINELWDLLQERILWVFEEDTGRLTLLDGREQKELASVEIPEGKVESLELGCISQFVPGEQILLRIDPGYFTEGSAIAEYPEDMPMLEIGVLLEEDEEGIMFSLGDIRTVQAAAD